MLFSIVTSAEPSSPEAATSRPSRTFTRAIAFALCLTVFSTGQLAARPKIGQVDTLERAYTRWSVQFSATGNAHRLVVPVGFSKGLSAQFSRAGGVVTIDLDSGEIDVEIGGLTSEGGYELWLIDNREGVSASVAIEAEDAAVSVGRLTDEDGYSRLASVLPKLPDGFEIDRFAISPQGVTPKAANAILYGSPSLFQRLFFYEIGRHHRFSRHVPAPHGGEANSPGELLELLEQLVEAGENLFINETFEGNGRTCATCHPPQNNFTIDPDFIASLPADDPLFVHENNPALSQLENAVLLRDFAMILANVDGLEDPTNKFVMRGVPHTLSLANSIFSGSPDIPIQNTGWSGDGAPNSGTLRDFAIGAVQQHATGSLDRIIGTDFRFPTEGELDEMEAFQLSLGRPDDLEILTMTLVDPDADAGRVLFNTTDSEKGTKLASKCILCHGQAGALSLPTGRNQNFDIGVEDQPHPADATGENRPRDGGFGTDFDPETNGFGNGRFATAPLVEAADTAPYFHNNVSDDLDDAIFFYQSDAFQQSPAGITLLNRDSGGTPLAIDTFKLGSFLRVINALENVRSALVYSASAQEEPLLEDAAPILDLAMLDIQDGIDVLSEFELQPNVIDEFENILSTVATAATTIDFSARNLLLDTARTALRATQPLMVVPRMRIHSIREGDVLSGSVDVASEVLDVDMQGISIEIDGVELCSDSNAPYSCSWDTTASTNGTHLVRAIALDYQDGTTVAEISVEVLN